MSVAGMAPGSIRVPRLLLSFLALLSPSHLHAGGGGGGGGGTLRRVLVRVTFISGKSFFLDKGRLDRLEVGDLVVFYPPAGGKLLARIKAAASSSSRAEPEPGFAIPDRRVRGEVLVPGKRYGSSEDKKEKARTEDFHPPWERTLETRGADTPLLSPAFGADPSERATHVHGRFFSHLQQTWDRARDRRSRFGLGQIGSELEADNLFGLGGSLYFDGQLDRRQVHLSNLGNEDDTSGRLNRFYYRMGRSRHRPFLVQLGRFQQREVPEFGLLDGVEFSVPLRGRSSAGLSFGAQPEPFAAQKTGDDVAASLFYRHVPGAEEDLTLGLAYQRSWHKGNEDRNLALLSADYSGIEGLFLSARAWIDYYGTGDRIKSRGIELTELQLNGLYTFATASGLSLYLSHLRLPELRRSEFTPVSAALIRDFRVFRLGLSSWHEIDEHWRVDGRFDYWDDQADDGIGGEVRGAARNLLYDAGEVSLSVFETGGRFTSGPGYRVAANRAFPFGFVSLSWEHTEVRVRQLFQGDTTLAQQALLSTVDLSVGQRTHLSVMTDYRYGEGQNSFGLGLFLQTYF